MSDTTATPAPTDTPVADPAATPPATPAAPPVADPAPAKAADATPPAPDKYELKAVEGLTMAEDVMANYAKTAKELGVSQEAAQKILETVGPQIQASQAKALETMSAQWEQQVIADKEIGGEKVVANLAIAKKAMESFATPELKSLLDSTKLGNHPEVVRLFYKLGTKISEDRTVFGKSEPGSTQSYAQRLYPNSN